MSEIDDRIATVWPGRPTTADVEATRLADLRAVKAEIERLAARVASLESAPRIVTAGSQDDDRVSPAPPAPLVERMAEAIRSAPTADDFDDDSIEWWTPVAQAALLVAAEDPAMLGDVTPDERALAWGAYCRATPGENCRDAVNAVLRARLAALGGKP